MTNLTDLVECGYLGGDCKMYYNSGTLAKPTWVEVDEAIDVSVPDFTDTMAEVATRAGSFAMEKPAKTRLAVEASYLWKANATVWEYLKGVKLAKDPIHIRVLDGDVTTTGTQGLEMIANLVQFPFNQALEEMSTHDTLRFTPRYACDGTGRVDPTWVVVASPETAKMGDSPEQIAKAFALVRSQGSRMSPAIVAKLVQAGKMKIVHHCEKITVEELIKKAPCMAEFMEHYPPDYIVNAEVFGEGQFVLERMSKEHAAQAKGQPVAPAAPPK